MGDATGDDSLHSSRSTTPALATGGHAGGTAPARARLGSLSDSAASSTNFLSLQASQPQQGPSQAAQEVRLASDVRVTAAAVEAVGPRETQEDAHVVGVGADVDDVLDRLWGQLHGLEPMQDCSEGEVQAGVAASAAANGRHAVLAVFDGHRGHGASQFAAARARPVFEAKLAEAVAGVTAAQRHAPARGLSSPDLDLTSTVLASALRATLHQLEHEYTSQWEVALAEAATKGARGGAVMEGAAKLGTCPGCTALVVVVWGGVLGVANVGDCRAVLWRDGRAVQLTRDHNAQVCLCVYMCVCQHVRGSVFSYVGVCNSPSHCMPVGSLHLKPIACTCHNLHPALITVSHMHPHALAHPPTCTLTPAVPRGACACGSSWRCGHVPPRHRRRVAAGGVGAAGEVHPLVRVKAGVGLGVVVGSGEWAIITEHCIT